MAFIQRRIIAQFDLNEGTFPDGSTRLTLEGLRMSVTVTQSGIPELAHLSADIYGMTLSQMNQLSTLGQTVGLIRKNTITIFAGDEGEEPGQIFSGTVFNAWGDFNSAPDVPFRVDAQAGLLDAVAPYPSTNPKGNVAAADLLKQFAAKWQGGMAFENNGVDVQLSNPHYYGSLKNQILMCLKEVQAWWNGGEGNVFAVWPVSGSRKSASVPVISKDTGMVGYPSFTQQGMIVRSIFFPSIRYGSLVKVNSTLKLPLTPNGQWQVYGITYELETLVPHGQWFMTLNLTPPGYVVIPPL